MEEWYPEAVRWPGPPDKTGYSDHLYRVGVGAICHSAEGYLPGALGRLESADEVSWHFTVDVTGVVFQHYNVLRVCWHAGNKDANCWYAGIEFIGRSGEPLTQAQVAAGTALLTWLACQEEWMAVRVGKWEYLAEHNWFSSTDCPCGRIPWSVLEGGINMALVKSDQLAEVVRQQQEMNAKIMVMLDQLRHGHDMQQQIINNLVNEDIPYLKGQINYLKRQVP